MKNLKQLSVLAMAALLLTGISGASTVAATPHTTPATGTSLTALITSLINSVGDDTFSVIDLTTLVSSTTSPVPLAHHATTNAQPSVSGSSTQHYGPYTSSSPDSGTCGNNWADDSFNRHFTVFQDRNDGSLLIVEQFKDGNFVTPSTTPPTTNQSPGACQSLPPPTGNGGTVAPGVAGSLHGYFVVPLPSGEVQTSADPHCDATAMTNSGCDTTTFIDTHFTPCYGITTPTCTVTTFFFHYTAGGQGLISNEWKNASADRGGNQGDIRST